jgi:hypothetical protein
MPGRLPLPAVWLAPSTLKDVSRKSSVGGGGGAGTGMGTGASVGVGVGAGAGFGEALIVVTGATLSGRSAGPSGLGLLADAAPVTPSASRPTTAAVVAARRDVLCTTERYPLGL